MILTFNLLVKMNMDFSIDNTLTADGFNMWDLLL